MGLSERINNIEESGIRKVFSLAGGRKNLINLSIGQPHFPTPQKIKKSAIKAIENNNNAYTQTKGLEELRQAVCEKLKSKNSIEAKLEEVMISSGVSGAIFLVFSALLNPEDELIVPDPYFVSYKQVADLYGIKTVYPDTYPGFKIDSAQLEKTVTPRTKAIILNSPNNPTGLVYSPKELKEIADFAQKHNLWIISDEIYEVFDYDNKFSSVGQFYKKTITVNGFSKSHSITGWRLGYIHAPEELIDAMATLQQYTFVCAPSPAQRAVLDNFDINLGKEVKYYKENRDLLYDELSSGYEFNKPEGAFYAFIKKPRENFVEELIENNLLVVPGEVFSGRDDYFRVSFAVQKDVLEKGINVLKNML